MRVGVPKEIKKNEHRIGLTPTAVREYVAHGHTVSVQTGAGLGAGRDEYFTVLICSFRRTKERPSIMFVI